MLPEGASEMLGWEMLGKLKGMILPRHVSETQDLRHFWEKTIMLPEQAFEMQGRGTFGKLKGMILPEHASEMPDLRNL